MKWRKRTTSDSPTGETSVWAIWDHGASAPERHWRDVFNVPDPAPEDDEPTEEEIRFWTARATGNEALSETMGEFPLARHRQVPESQSICEAILAATPGGTLLD